MPLETAAQMHIEFRMRRRAMCRGVLADPDWAADWWRALSWCIRVRHRCVWRRWPESCSGWETVEFFEGKVRSGGLESCVALRCESRRGELGFQEGCAEDWFGWRADGVSLVRSAVLGDVPLGWEEGEPALERMRQVTEAGRIGE